MEQENNKLSVFETLSKIKCKTEKKGRFDYVSWAEAWKNVKKAYPNANFKVYETEKGFPAFVSDKIGGFVKVGVTIEELEHIEHFPILNNYNKSISKDIMTSFDINTSIKRALVKCLAFHGLGLHVYDGEEFVEDKE